MDFEEIKHAYRAWSEASDGSKLFYADHLDIDRSGYDSRVSEFVQERINDFEHIGFVHVGEYARDKLHKKNFENPVNQELTCISARPDGTIISWGVFHTLTSDEIGSYLIIEGIDIQYDPKKFLLDLEWIMFEPDRFSPLTRESLQNEWKERVEEMMEGGPSPLYDFQMPDSWLDVLGAVMKIPDASPAILLSRDFPNLTSIRDVDAFLETLSQKSNVATLEEGLQKAFEQVYKIRENIQNHQNLIRFKQLPSWVQRMVKPEKDVHPELKIYG